MTAARGFLVGWSVFTMMLFSQALTAAVHIIGSKYLPILLVWVGTDAEVKTSIMAAFHTTMFVTYWVWARLWIGNTLGPQALKALSKGNENDEQPKGQFYDRG